MGNKGCWMCFQMEGNNIDGARYKILAVEQTRAPFEDEFEAWKRTLVPQTNKHPGASSKVSAREIEKVPNEALDTAKRSLNALHKARHDKAFVALKERVLETQTMCILRFQAPV